MNRREFITTSALSSIAIMHANPIATAMKYGEVASGVHFCLLPFLKGQPDSLHVCFPTEDLALATEFEYSYSLTRGHGKVARDIANSSLMAIKELEQKRGETT